MKPFTTAAVCIFTLVSLTHLCRIFTGWDVTIAGTVIPMWVSYLGALLAGGLAVMRWGESHKIINVRLQDQDPLRVPNRGWLILTLFLA